jgi:acetoin:2,6-dichlorophenolindophenol oxidoreductase subunit beta
MTQITIQAALNKTLHRMMHDDNTIIFFGEDVVGGSGIVDGKPLGGMFGVSAGLRDAFGPERVFDTPISEASFIGMATGAAMTGMRPIVELMFCDFIGVCFDQIINQAAKVRFLSGGNIAVPMVIRATMGAGDGSAAVHSQSLAHLLTSIAGLHVAMPATPSDAASLLQTAIACNDPVIFLEHKGLYDFQEDVPDNLILAPQNSAPLGKGRIVMAGSDVTIVAFSAMLHKAEAVAHKVAKVGITIDLIDPRWAAPLDLELILTSVERTGRLIVVDEGAAHAGLAAEVISQVCRHGFHHLKCAPVAITPPHTPVPYGKNLEQAWLPSEDDIEAQLHIIIQHV